MQYSLMYDTRSSDFLSFSNKLSKEQRKDLFNSSYMDTLLGINKPFLKAKVNEEMIISVLTILLKSAQLENELLEDGEVVFNFMLEHLINDLFE